MARPQNAEVENAVKFGFLAPQWRHNKAPQAKFGTEAYIPRVYSSVQNLDLIGEVGGYMSPAEVKI